MPSYSKRKNRKGYEIKDGGIIKLGSCIKKYEDKECNGKRDCYWHAYKKTDKQGYKPNASKYSHDMAVLGTGNYTKGEHPKIMFSIESVDENGKIGEEYACMDAKAFIVDQNEVSDNELNENIGCEACLTRDSDSCSSIHIVSNNSDGLRIPERGMWKLHIGDRMPLGKQGNLKTVKGYESGYYDIKHHKKNYPESVTDGGTNICISETKCSPLLENEYDNHSLPKINVTFNVTRSINNTDYYLKGARVLFMYDNDDECFPIAQTSKRFINKTILKRHSFSKLINPNQCNTTETLSGKKTCEYFDRSGLGNFKKCLSENLSIFSETYKCKNLSVKISRGNDSNMLFESDFGDSDTLYDFGNVSRSISSVVLMKLLNSRERQFHWDTKHSDCNFVCGTLLKGTELGRSLSSLYMKSCGLPGPTLFQLLTNTSGLPDHFSMPLNFILDEMDSGRILNTKYKQGEKQLTEILSSPTSKLLYYPGSKVHESSIGWSIISCIIKKLSASKYVFKSVHRVAKSMSMHNCSLSKELTQFKSSSFSGKKSVILCDSGLAGQSSDLHNFMRSVRSSTCSEGSKTTIMPTYRLNDNSTICNTPGNWLCADVLSKKATRSKKYTLLSTTGWSPSGDGVMACYIEEYDLNVSVCFSQCKAEHSSNLLDDLIRKIHKQYKKCLVPSKNYESFINNRVPSNQLKTYPLPPFWSRITKAEKLAKYKNRSYYTLNSVSANDSKYIKDNYDSILSSASSNNVLLPLFSTSRIENFLVVKKVTKKSKRGTMKYGFMLNFYKKEQDIGNSKKCKISFAIKYDSTSANYRLIDEDGSYGDPIQIYYSSSYEKRVTSIQLFGITYCTKSFVQYQYKKVRYGCDKIRSEIESDEYNTKQAIASEIEPIGASYAGSVALAGLLGAGAGYLAGSTSSRFYDNYNRVYDPYHGYYYTNPYYVPPLWSNPYWRRYRSRRFWNPFWTNRGRGYPRRYVRPRYSRGRISRPWRRRSIINSGRQRRAMRRSRRRSRRRSMINESIDNHKNIFNETIGHSIECVDINCGQ